MAIEIPSDEDTDTPPQSHKKASLSKLQLPKQATHKKKDCLDELSDESQESPKPPTPNTVHKILETPRGMIDKKDLEYLSHVASGTSGDVYRGLYRGYEVAIKVNQESPILIP